MSDPLLETTFNFAGKTFQVRPTFKLVAKIEAALDQSSQTLGRKAANGTISLTETAAMMTIIAGDQNLKNAAGERMTPDEVGELIMTDGARELMAPLAFLLLRASKGNKEHERESAAKPPPDPQD